MFASLARSSVSNRPIWLVDAACLSMALPPTIHRMAGSRPIRRRPWGGNRPPGRVGQNARPNPRDWASPQEHPGQLAGANPRSPWDSNSRPDRVSAGSNFHRDCRGGPTYWPPPPYPERSDLTVPSQDRGLSVRSKTRQKSSHAGHQSQYKNPCLYGCYPHPLNVGCAHSPE